MAARQHSRVVHFVLPWLVAAVGLGLFLVTLNPWVSFDAVEVVSKVAGWDWNTMQLGPVTLLVTWPVRWLPPAAQPAALNVLSALLGGAVLGMLAKSVALLPHDRTREQRQRERSDFSFLTIPLAWVPPVAAAGLLAVQLTFWEHATAMTGEMITLALFAFCIFSYLRFRVLQEDRYLAFLSFAFGAAAANDWGVIAFCPLFVVAIIWAKGIRFFDAKFLVRTTAAGLAGTLLYLVTPVALKMTGQAEGSVFELLRTQLGYQRQFIFSFPRANLAFCAVGSLLPVIFMGVRWPSTFGDMSAAGSALTNLLFRVIHGAFLAFCVWTLYDPPFSPRMLGYGLPFLHLYFLSALAVGYMAGYFLLVFGQEPERKMRRASEGMQALGRLTAVGVAAGCLGAVGALAWYNLPAVRGQNGPLVRQLTTGLTSLPAGTNTVLLSDDNTLLMLAVGQLTSEGHRPEVIPVSTPVLRHHVYQRHHELRYPVRWPALAIERLSNPLNDDILLRQVVSLTFTNQLLYLHPSFGYFFEVLQLAPTNGIYALRFAPTNTFLPRPLPEDAFAAVHAHWEGIRRELVENPVIARMREQRVTDAGRVGAHYSRALNAHGVSLQLRGRLEDARVFFDAARELNPDNLAAVINLRFNEHLRAGNTEAVQLEQELTNQLGRYRDLPSFMSLCGPVDDPAFCFNIGRVFSDGGLYFQAAAQFARAAELQPTSIDARLWLANSVLRAGLSDEVLRVVRELRSGGHSLTPAQDTDLAGLEAWARFRQGDLPAAERLLEGAQLQHPDLTQPLQTLLDIYLAANQTNAALATVEKLVARKPEDKGPLITRSAIQMQMGSLDASVETLNGVLARDPAFFPALINRALAYYRLGRLDDAEKDYLKLLETAPKMTTIYYHLGEIDYQRRRPAAARRHYQRYLEKAVPGSPEARAAEQRLDDIAAGKLGG